MNCPGHMLLFGSALRSYRDLPLRYAESSTLHRDELAGTLHGLLRVRHITQDDAHIFCTQEQIEDEIFGCLDFASLSLRPLRPRGARSSSRRGRRRRSAPTRSGTSPRARSRPRSSRRGHRLRRERGRRRLLRPEDRPAHDRRPRPLLADGDDPARRDHAAALRPHLHGADNREHTPYVIHRALLGSLERFIGILIEHYGGAFPFWLAPVQVRVLPVGEAHLEPAQRDRASAPRAPATGSTSASRPRRSASGSAAAELEKIPFVDRLRRPRERGEPGDPRARRRPEPGIACGFRSRSLLRLPPEKQERTRSSPPGPRRCALARGSTESKFVDEDAGRCMQRLFCVVNEYEEE